MVADVMRSQIRDVDVLGRYGGEEFVVLGEPHTVPGEMAERLRSSIAEAHVMGPSGPVRVTVSVGVAQLAPGDDLERLLARADRALYRGKDAGRNRVAIG